MTDRRVQTITGDVGTDGLGLDDAGRAALASCDVVIHSAATVSFDSPLDSAVEVNLLGPTRIAQTLQDPRGRPPPGRRVHLLRGRQPPGLAPEQPSTTARSTIDVDWRAEVAAARRPAADPRPRAAPRHARRVPPRPAAELGAAGTPLLAAKTEQLRTRWVSDQLVEAGRARAASLGWPDAYAYTKALGERALRRTEGRRPRHDRAPVDHRVAWAEPKPGWIRGFRMAEPVIISYARGLLKEFPGVPEGIVDVIPVDLVVAAIIAVAAALGPDGRTPITQVASGSANPLKYRRWSTWCAPGSPSTRSTTPRASPSSCPSGRSRAGAGCRASSSGPRHHRARPSGRCSSCRCAASRPSGRPRSREARGGRAGAHLRRALRRLRRVRGRLRSTNLLAAWEALSADDQEAVLLRPAGHRLGPLRHRDPPAVGGRARPGEDDARRRPATRRSACAAQVLSPTATWPRSTSRTRSSPRTWWSLLVAGHPPAARGRPAAFALRTLREAPSLLALDRKDRSDFLRYFYRRYEDAPVDQLERTPGAVQPPHPHQVVPRRHPPGARAPGARPPHRAHHRRARLRGRAAAAAVRRHRRRRDDGRKPTARYTGELSTCRPPARPGPSAWPTTAPPRPRPRRGGRLRRLHLRPADARGRRLPGGGQPRDPPGRAGPQAGLAGRALGQGAGRRPPLLPIARPSPRIGRGPTAHGRVPVKALEFSRKPARFAAAVWPGASPPGAAPGRAAVASRRRPAGAPGPAGSRVRPRLAGICGSDLATVDGRSSRYFEPIVSFPFVPGHEVVGDLADGTRVVVEPVLGCATRGIDPVCDACARGDPGQLRAHRLRPPRARPADRLLLRHRGRLEHADGGPPEPAAPVPDDLSDEAAVMVEPTACAVHAASRGRSSLPATGRGVIGAGTLGLLTIAALRHLTPAGTDRRRGPSTRTRSGWPSELGADRGRGPGELPRLVRRHRVMRSPTATSSPAAPTPSSTASARATPSAQRCHRVAPAAGHLVGMPAKVTLDLTTLWHRETRWPAATPTAPTCPRASRRRLRPAFELVRRPPTSELVSATYPLARYEDAIEHAAAAGRRGAVKIAFDLAPRRKRRHR
jgi:hypothetical protein